MHNYPSPIVVGDTISEQAYQDCIEAIKALEPPRATCARLGISRGTYLQAGKLALGSDEFHRLVAAAQAATRRKAPTA